MKKLIAVVMVLALLCASAAAVEIADPWRETTAEELVETLGLSFCVPTGAENVVYRMMESEAVAEMHFTLDDVEYTARIKPALELEDISGMHYEWGAAEPCEILWCPGEIRQINADGRNIALCLWYDVVPGLMYSVGAVAPEDVELDILAMANALFAPAQGDADAAPADVLAEALAACTGYEGTAGSSLKEAAAACGLLDFAVNHSDAESVEEIVLSALAALSDVQRQELAFSIEGVNALIESAFADYASIAGLFDDAGVGEAMQPLIKTPNAQEQWNALYALLQTEE